MHSCQQPSVSARDYHDHRKYHVKHVITFKFVRRFWLLLFSLPRKCPRSSSRRRGLRTTQTMSDTLEMSVKMWYVPPKSHCFSNWQLGLATLREDLTLLKLPHPKAENVQFQLLPNGSTACQFTWPNTRPGGVSSVCLSFSCHSRHMSIWQALYRQLKTYICSDGSERWEAFKELITSLSMCVSVIP